MFAAQKPIPPCVLLLADNLDAALALGEDLAAAGKNWDKVAAIPSLDVAMTRAAQRDAIEVIRRRELNLVARVLNARARSEDLARADVRFKSVARLFVASTNILVDAVIESADATSNDFETGDAAVAYLRTRNLLAADASGATATDRLIIGDDFLVAKRIALGVLLNLVAMFLDTLETQFDLFVEDDAGIVIIEDEPLAVAVA